MKKHPHITPERLRSLPRLPGIYVMKDRDGDVIYVGKAKNLRARVRSYFSGGDGRYSIPYLVKRVTAIETVVTEDEAQALVLENDFIKRFKPQYNIRLKDDRAHLVVRIDENQEWPRIELVRKIVDDGARYIGPFAYGYELRTLLDVVRNALPLRSCSDRVFMNRVRPCLEYQMKRCSGPCCLEVDPLQYRQWVKTAAQILEGKNADLIGSMTQEMLRASDELRFEDAAALRDRIEAVKRITIDEPAMFFSQGAKDAFGICREGGNVEFSVLSVRQGRLFGSRTFGFEGNELPNGELLGSMVSQFYSGEEEIPEEILLPFPLEDIPAREALYSERRGSKVSILFPKRGDKARLVALAQENARENYTARLGGAGGRDDRDVKALQMELQLAEVPRTMECVDISHFQGGSTVASVVFFQDGRPEKSRYRHFHLTQEGKPDDFASMREVVTRHLSRCAEENTVCDLMIIDGGTAQLNQALGVRRELGLQMPAMIGLAKKRSAKIPYFGLSGGGRTRGKKPERVFVEGQALPIVLRESSRALRLLERIRDEAHRFAVTFHRSVRSRRAFVSVLEQIPGVGEKRRKELLRVFGSVKKIAEAQPADLEAAGVPEKLAIRIIEILGKKLRENG